MGLGYSGISIANHTRNLQRDALTATGYGTMPGSLLAWAGTRNISLTAMRKMHADSLPDLVTMATRLGLLPVTDGAAIGNDHR